MPGLLEANLYVYSQGGYCFLGVVVEGLGELE